MNIKILIMLLLATSVMAQDTKGTSDYDTLKSGKQVISFYKAPSNALYNSFVVRNRSNVSDTIKAYSIDKGDTILLSIRNWYKGTDDTLLIVPPSGTFEYFLLNPNIDNVLFRLMNSVETGFVALLRARKVKL